MRRLIVVSTGLVALGLLGVFALPSSAASTKWTSCSKPYVKHAFIGGVQYAHPDIQIKYSAVRLAPPMVEAIWKWKLKPQSMVLCPGGVTLTNRGHVKPIKVNKGARNGTVTYVSNPQVDQSEALVTIRAIYTHR